MTSKKFTFIDLFAGIGGIRIAFETHGGECVMSSEYNPFSQKTYRTFFGETPDFSEIITVTPAGDITQLPPNLVPDHTILTAGFPCQPFSLAGVSKKNSLGRPHGFDDPTQGTLFFNIKEILAAKRPDAFLLENVKNLKQHDRGTTYSVIRDTLDSLGYDVFDRVIDAAGWTPQHRERIYIIGFRRPEGGQNWRIDCFPEFEEMKPPAQRDFELDEILETNVPDKYILGPGTWDTLVRHKAHHKEQGNGFGYGLLTPPFRGQVTRTLSARYHKDGAEILIDIGRERPRRLTPLECCRLMGFPEEYQKYFSRDIEIESPVSETQAYRQFGNSVVVPVVRDIARIMVKRLVEVGAI
jgi:DNA (cytosine-5)-methyltransferase 1